MRVFPLSMRLFLSCLLFLIFLAGGFSGCSKPQQRIVQREELSESHFANYRNTRFMPEAGNRGMVVSVDQQASEWGARILRRGGNAVDAAVATAFALAVTRPQFASLGGGGFFLYCPAPQKGIARECVAVDYREKAPVLSTRDMFVRGPDVLEEQAKKGGLASGVPGVVAGLFYILDHYGTKSRQELISEPMKWASGGFEVSGYMNALLKSNWERLNSDAKAIFSCQSTRLVQRPLEPCEVGEVLRQTDLSRVLEVISRQGSKGFYEGIIARKLVQGIRDAGGIMSLEDLASYEPRLRTPLRGEFRGYEIVTMPPPSAGGISILQMFHYLTRAKSDGAFKLGPRSAAAMHALTHAMALSFRDRAALIGDPDFVKIPMENLLNPHVLNQKWDETYRSRKKNIPEAELLSEAEGMNTTHLSVVDRFGNAVAITTTVNSNFGSGVVPAGTGVVMNNEMDDFSIRPGVPNQFGLVGTQANAIAPEKRPVSSMAPTVVRNADGTARVVIGAAGGSRIPTSIFLALANRLEFGMSMVDAVYAPRFHHQWKPEILFFERFGFAFEVVDALESMGYEVEESVFYARMNAIERFSDGSVWGIPDPRTEGVAVSE